MTTRELLIAVGLVVLGYLFGSLSPSVFLGRAFKGLDVRHHGSGNAGTTNAFRVLGKSLGVTVFILDILKGVIPVVLARYLSSPLMTVFVAFACVMGHQYSIFLRGRGGKGVATGAGCAIGMMPIPMAFLLGLFVLLVFTTRIASIASITCTIGLPIMAAVLHQPLEYVIACCLMAMVVLWAHRANIKRLVRGEERRFTFPWNKKPDTSQPPAKAEEQ